MLEIIEPINVWVFFKKNRIVPHSFFWGERHIKIDKVNMVHTSKVGMSLFYHFSVSGGNNFYRLGFDSNTLKWQIEAVEEGDDAW